MSRNDVGADYFTMTDGNVPRQTAPVLPEQPWEKLLIERHAPLVRARRAFRYLPSAPRCKVCNNPFGGPVGHDFAAAGFRPSRKNPNLCSRCCDALPPGGAEVDVAVLFADVRGSTALGQTRSCRGLRRIAQPVLRCRDTDPSAA
jgi:adenylate cyclase